MNEDSKQRRKRLDRERYLRERDDRLLRQRAYYKENKEEILRKRKLRYMESVGINLIA